MRHPMLPLALLLLVLLLGGRADADELVLQGGTRLTGVVLSQDEAAVRLLQPQGDEVFLAPDDVKEVRRDADAPKGDEVMRYSDGAKGRPQGLQVALVHLLHPGTGRRVDLVGAVHIADLEYYREVQRLLEQVDVVLYEMVKPRDARPDATSSSEESLSVRGFQTKMAEWFGLAFQLDAISYGRPHFVHADMTLEEFNGEASGPAVREQMRAMGPALKVLDAVLKTAPAKPDRGTLLQRTLKGLLGRALGGMGARMATLLGDDAADLLISRRNAVAVKRLTEVAPEARTVAIFYGAAHLPDLEKRLAALGYVRAGARWLTAWDTRPPKETPAADKDR